jgi:guanylate kinase
VNTDGEARPAARLTVLAGPSGAGRDSVVELVRARSPSLWVPVPATTRSPHGTERDGVDRVFLDPAEFDRLATTGQLLEWARIGPFRRGTPASPIRSRLRAGRPVLLPSDPSGALQVRAAFPGARLVLLRPPGYHPPAALADAVAYTLTHDHTERVVAELVGLLGSSDPAPGRTQPAG